MKSHENTTYSADQIIVLDAVEAVRRRPGMYIGDVRDGSGLHYLAQAIVDHSLERHRARRVRHLRVDVDERWVTVEDDGPGLARAELDAALTSMHGDRLGFFPVSAVCERFEVESRSKGRVLRAAYERGVCVQPVTFVATSDRPGLRARFRADSQIFPSPTFDPDRLAPIIEDAALLNPLLEVRFQGRVIENREGLTGWVGGLVNGDVVSANVLGVDAAIGFGEQPSSRFFVNGKRCSEGDHVRGLWEGIGDAACVKSTIAREMLEHRLVVGLALDVEHPVFANGFARRLVSPSARLAVRRVVGEMLKRRFAAEPLAALRARGLARRRAR